MTQLVKLQERRAEIEKAGYDLFAISYDSPAELAAFAERHGIEFPLLSDEDSKVIREFGILNTLIEPDEERYYGIPFPGTYVTDAKGMVTAKFFSRHYATRVSAGTLVSGLGDGIVDLLEAGEAPATTGQGRGLSARAFLADSDLQMEVESTLWVRLQMDDGLYIYTDPLPTGFIATTVEVLPSEGLRFGRVVYPEAQIKEFPDLGVSLPVYVGTADFRVPIKATAKLLGMDVENQTNGFPVTVRVSYQTCSASFCFTPQTLDLYLEVPAAPLTLPQGAQ